MCRPAQSKVRLRWSVRLKARRSRHLALWSLARALVYAEGTRAAHEALLAGAFAGTVEGERLARLTARTLTWMEARPAPRVRVLQARLAADEDLRFLWDRLGLRDGLVLAPARMRSLAAARVPVIETVGALGEWLRLDPEHLAWFADLRDWNGRAADGRRRHYVVRLLGKADGGVRVVEAPKQRLKAVQRQIARGLLAGVGLHEAVHGFRAGRSIVTFAAPHVGQAAVLRMDLQEFFASISGARVGAMFRTLGYPEAVADVLGGLCTVTTPREVWAGVEGVGREEMARLRSVYGRPHLPQGAPTSPAVANVCAFRLDRRLAGLAAAACVRYTRYADDLAFSGDGGFGRAAARFAARVAAIVAEEGFALRHRKTRLMRAAGRQRLAGLVVNEGVGLERRELERLEAVLFNCVTRGPEGENREGRADFRRHLEGRVAFVAMVQPEKAAWLRELLRRVRWV